MFHARLLNVIVICLCLSGCCGGGGPADGDKGPVTKANFEKILADGSGNLAAVETILGGKGMKLPKEAWKKHDIDSAALPFRKAKLIKGGDDKPIVVADDSGSEAEVFRWGDDDKYIYVAVLEQKVVRKSIRGN